jgi:hypothetical protein
VGWIFAGGLNSKIQQQQQVSMKLTAQLTKQLNLTGHNKMLLLLLL